MLKPQKVMAPDHFISLPKTVQGVPENADQGEGKREIKKRDTLFLVERFMDVLF